MSELNDLFDQVSPLESYPVDRWQPEKTVDIDIRILRDGSWHYRGSPIARRKIVQLFGMLLRREGEDCFIVTPQVRYRITVEDAPFLAVEMETTGHGDSQCVHFRTNTDDVITVDSDHPVRVESDADTGSPRPYVTVRPGLDARITRPVYYQLAELLAGDTQGAASSPSDGGAVGFISSGSFFSLEAA